MAGRSGYATKTAVRRPAETSAYGTEAAGVTNQIPLISESMTKAPTLVGEDAVVGLAGEQERDLVALNPSGAINCELWFEGLEYLVFAATGFECPDLPVARDTTPGVDEGGSPAPDTAATPNAFVHIFEPDENLQREYWSAGERAVSGAGDYAWSASTEKKVRSVSVCFDKGEEVDGSSVEHFVDAMVNKMTIKGTLNSMTIDFELIPRSSSFTGSSAAWALPASVAGAAGHTLRMKFPQVAFYIDAPGATLTTAVPISGFEITVDNKLRGDDYDTGGQDISAGLTYRAEPVRDSKRTTTVKLDFARMNATTNAVRGYLEDGTNKQMALVVTGPTILNSDSDPFRFVFAMPSVKTTLAEFPIAGPGVITGKFEGIAQLPAAPDTTYALAWVVALFEGIVRTKKAEFFILLENRRGSCFARDDNTTYPLP